MAVSLEQQIGWFWCLSGQNEAWARNETELHKASEVAIEFAVRQQEKRGLSIGVEYWSADWPPMKQLAPGEERSLLYIVTAPPRMGTLAVRIAMLQTYQEYIDTHPTTTGKTDPTTMFNYRNALKVVPDIVVTGGLWVPVQDRLPEQ